MIEEKNNLLEQFMKISWFLMRKNHHHDYMGFGHSRNPYRGQGRVLKLLKIKPETTQKELSELLDMRPQSLGDLLKKLEQNGYITRTPSENDKRAMIVKLTEKGANEEIGDEKQLGSDSIFGCLSEEEQANMSKYFKRIIDSWNDDNEQETGFDFHGFHHHRKW
jgi:DNA-binding MarR family transcriptional regulator